MLPVYSRSSIMPVGDGIDRYVAAHRGGNPYYDRLSRRGMGALGTYTSFAGRYDANAPRNDEIE